MSVSETAPLTVHDVSQTAPSGRFFNNIGVPLAELRREAYENQDPFTVLTQLNPEGAWQPEASMWAERALEQLHSGRELEVRFNDKFLHSLLGSTALARWRQKASQAPVATNDAGLALLWEHGAMRHPTGLHRLYIPGSQVSNLRARTFDERRRGVAGLPSDTRYHIVDMQIKTAVDKPVFVFSPRRLADGTKLRPVESEGSWFSFPLPEVQLSLI